MLIRPMGPLTSFEFVILEYYPQYKQVTIMSCSGKNAVFSCKNYGIHLIQFFKCHG